MGDELHNCFHDCIHDGLRALAARVADCTVIPDRKTYPVRKRGIVIISVECSKSGTLYCPLYPVDENFNIIFDNTTGDAVPPGDWLWVGIPILDEEQRGWLIMDDRNGAWFERGKIGYRFHHGVIPGEGYATSRF